MVLGDFNAINSLCGSPRADTKGNIVAELPTDLDIRLHNSGNKACVLWQGESIVELSWVTQETMKYITVCRVMDNVEALSDHLYINERLHISTYSLKQGHRADSMPSWAGRLENARSSPLTKIWTLREMMLIKFATQATETAWPNKVN